jgi:hypothetical protein
MDFDQAFLVFLGGFLMGGAFFVAIVEMATPRDDD